MGIASEIRKLDQQENQEAVEEIVSLIMRLRTLPTNDSGRKAILSDIVSLAKRNITNPETIDRWIDETETIASGRVMRKYVPAAEAQAKAARELFENVTQSCGREIVEAFAKIELVGRIYESVRGLLGDLKNHDLRTSNAESAFPHLAAALDAQGESDGDQPTDADMIATLGQLSDSPAQMAGIRGQMSIDWATHRGRQLCREFRPAEFRIDAPQTTDVIEAVVKMLEESPALKSAVAPQKE